MKLVIDISIILSVIVALLVMVVIASGLVIAFLSYLTFTKKTRTPMSSSAFDVELTCTRGTDLQYNCSETETVPEQRVPIYDTPSFKEQLPVNDNVAYGHFK